MISDFNKNFLEAEYRKQLYRIQLYGYKPSFLGLITLENCFDSTGYEGHKTSTLNGNGYNGLETYEIYKDRFSFISKLLLERGDLPVYPSKEEFFNLLFLNGKYRFLNLACLGFNNAQYCDDNGELDEVHTYRQTDHEESQYSNNRSYITRIKKGNVIRFYNKELANIDAFDDESCYLTLSIEDTSDEEFNDIFKVSNFLPENADIKSPIHLRVHNFILKLIEQGKIFTEKNPTLANHPNITDVNDYNKKRPIHIMDGESVIEYDWQFNGKKSLSVGETITVNNQKRKVVAINILNSQAREAITTLVD